MSCEVESFIGAGSAFSADQKTRSHSSPTRGSVNPCHRMRGRVHVAQAKARAQLVLLYSVSDGRGRGQSGIFFESVKKVRTDPDARRH